MKSDRRWEKKNNNDRDNINEEPSKNLHTKGGVKKWKGVVKREEKKKKEKKKKKKK